MINKPRPIQFSQAGYRALQPKLAQLQKKREVVLIELQRAREQGDLSENGAYKAARFELGDTERQIRQLKHLIKYGVATPLRTDGVVGIGSVVKLRRDDGAEFVYTIVGTYEADPLKGLISIESPMGKKLVGSCLGSEVVVNGRTYRVTP